MLSQLIARSVFIVALFACPMFGQQRVSPENLHSRAIAVVPMIGAGTLDDPKRPMFAPSPAEMAKRNQAVAQAAVQLAAVEKAKPSGTPGTPPTQVSGILSFHYQMSDDRQSALVEFVGSDRQAIQPILSSGDSRVKAFERDKDTKDDIEKEFKKHKKDLCPCPLG